MKASLTTIYMIGFWMLLQMSASAQISSTSDPCRQELLSLYEAMAKKRFSITNQIVHIKLRQSNWSRSAGEGVKHMGPVVHNEDLVESYQSNEGLAFRSGSAEYVLLKERDEAYFIAHDVKRVYLVTRSEGERLSSAMNDLILTGQRNALLAANKVECRPGNGVRTFSVDPDTGTRRRAKLEKITFETTNDGRILTQDFFFQPGSFLLRQRLEYLAFEISPKNKPGFIEHMVLAGPDHKLAKRLKGYEFVNNISDASFHN